MDYTNATVTSHTARHLPNIVGYTYLRVRVGLIEEIWRVDAEFDSTAPNIQQFGEQMFSSAELVERDFIIAPPVYGDFSTLIALDHSDRTNEGDLEFASHFIGNYQRTTGDQRHFYLSAPKPENWALLAVTNEAFGGVEDLSNYYTIVEDFEKKYPDEFEGLTVSGNGNGLFFYVKVVDENGTFTDAWEQLLNAAADIANYGTYDEFDYYERVNAAKLEGILLNWDQIAKEEWEENTDEDRSRAEELLAALEEEGCATTDEETYRIEDMRKVARKLGILVDCVCPTCKGWGCPDTPRYQNAVYNWCRTCEGVGCVNEWGEALTGDTHKRALVHFMDNPRSNSNSGSDLQGELLV